MKFRKRQLILASLIVALGTAVYLNWQFSENKTLETTNILESTDELGEARYVNNSHFSEDESTTSSNFEKTSDFFAEAQISRQKAHEEAEEKLKSLLSNSSITAETKESINKSIEALSKISKQESTIENLIKAKGFSQCLVFIENNECNVIVSPGSMNENSGVIIRDIVTSQSDIPSSKVKIIEAKK